MARDPHPVDASSKGGGTKNTAKGAEEYAKGHQAGKDSGQQDPWSTGGGKK